MKFASFLQGRVKGVKTSFLTVRLGLVSLYQAPRQERPTKEKHETVKRLN
jgi:hypothetical protein